MESVMKNYGVHTHCPQPLKNFLVQIARDDDHPHLYGFALHPQLSLASFGLIPYFGKAQTEVTVIEDNNSQTLGKIDLVFENKYHVFNAENSKRVKDNNTANYGEPDHYLAPLGASIAVFILQKLNSVPRELYKGPTSPVAEH